MHISCRQQAVSKSFSAFSAPCTARRCGGPVRKNLSLLPTTALQCIVCIAMWKYYSLPAQDSSSTRSLTACYAAASYAILRSRVSTGLKAWNTNLHNVIILKGGGLTASHARISCYLTQPYHISYLLSTIRMGFEDLVSTR